MQEEVIRVLQENQALTRENTTLRRERARLATDVEYWRAEPDFLSLFSPPPPLHAPPSPAQPTPQPRWCVPGTLFTMVTRFAASTTHGQLPEEARPRSRALRTSNLLNILTPRLTVWSGRGHTLNCALFSSPLLPCSLSFGRLNVDRTWPGRRRDEATLIWGLRGCGYKSHSCRPVLLGRCTSAHKVPTYAHYLQLNLDMH